MSIIPAGALARFRRPAPARSLLEIVITAGPLVAIGVLSVVLYHFGLWWAALALSAPAAAFLVRLFMVQHDCGHQSFFAQRPINDWVGRIAGVLTLTPYDYWRDTHAVHHATSGDLGRRGLGDIQTLTVAEYAALPWARRMAYRVLRHPAVLFGVGPAYLFLLQNRLPIGRMKAGVWPWVSTMGTNLAIVVLVGAAVAFGGAGPLLLTYLPAALLASSIGVWLFFIQHQFEDTFWAEHGQWSMQEAAVRGASHYDLPAILRWFTGNIGFHHIHHLSSRIPYYRLPTVLKQHPELEAVTRLTLFQSFACARLALWDEARQRLVSFRDARRAAPISA